MRRLEENRTSGFELEVGETIRLHALGPEDRLDRDTDLILWKKGGCDAAKLQGCPTRNVLETIEGWHTTLYERWVGVCHAFRICDTGETVIRMVQSLRRCPNGVTIRYEVAWVTGQPEEGKERVA